MPPPPLEPLGSTRSITTCRKTSVSTGTVPLLLCLYLCHYHTLALSRSLSHSGYVSVSMPLIHQALPVAVPSKPSNPHKYQDAGTMDQSTSSSTYRSSLNLVRHSQDLFSSADLVECDKSKSSMSDTTGVILKHTHTTVSVSTQRCKGSCSGTSG